MRQRGSGAIKRAPSRYLARADLVRRCRQLSASMSATWRRLGASTALATLCSTLTPISLRGATAGAEGGRVSR